MTEQRTAFLPGRRSLLLTALIALIGVTVLFTAMRTVHSAAQPGPKPTIVLVHGAWADSSSWTDVIERLQREGYPVLAAANPLRGLTSDSEYIASVLDSIPGPVVLVGHSYGGAVITNAATGKPNVKALAYIAAYIPDMGETLGGLTIPSGGSQLNPATSLIVRPYPGGGQDAFIKPELFRQLFAADVPANTIAVMAAIQRPIEVTSLFVPSGAPAWKMIPSFCLVATEDITIGTRNVQTMADRACGEGKAAKVSASHAVLVSKPNPVADFILRAAHSVQ